MNYSPYALSEELKEMLCMYLETAHRISNEAVAQERAALVRRPGTIGQLPFVESTPRFRTGSWLRDLNLSVLPEELAQLARFGLPTEKFPLYAHQEAALRAAWTEGGGPGDLIVASGTGSGKTECFYLPILADILREARQWRRAEGPGSPSEWNARRKEWQHGRRHERRTAALRAIVLYPMNALVNDQLRRLRQTLDSTESLAWQRRHLNGNLLHFGRYTSQTELPGRPEDERRRGRWKDHLNRIRTGWESVGDELRNSGGWPRPDGAEMLNRWDMQAAPPDILVTNYSMLEYMLVRPIEAEIFEQTRRWLAESKDHILTLVLDEAHSYTGAQGTEVAYLIRRLFERLGAGPEQVRCVATSATLGSSQEDLLRVRRFASDLFGHDEDRFTVVQAEHEEPPENLRRPTAEEMKAFARFQDRIEREDHTEPGTMEATSRRLVQDLRMVTGEDASPERLYDALREHPRLLDIRGKTARQARAFGDLAESLWEGMADEQSRYRATAGLLSAGAYARQGGNPEVPPLLPSRLHLMFRGLTGMWACVDPGCKELDASEAGGDSRPCGKLYAEPRIWCDCSARVLELFHCRVCGLLFLGGIPDPEGRLWPYESDLEGGFQRYARYHVFAAENPGLSGTGGHAWVEERRSIGTTAVVDRDERVATRATWVSSDQKARRHVPSTCPRCNARQSPTSEVVRPMRSTGPQSLRILMEHAFRCQPPRVGLEKEVRPTPAEPEPQRRWFRAKGDGRQETSVPKTANPNRGRKALVFSDGRQEAATLAGNLTYLHTRDVFRQLLLLVLGEHSTKGDRQDLPVPELRERVMEAAIRRGVDPTFGELESFWSTYGASPYEAKKAAAPILDVYLRREIADREVGVETLGFARWVLDFEGEDVTSLIPPLAPFDSRETVALLYAVLRILAAENVILPSSLDPQDWPRELVETWSRQIVVRASTGDSAVFSWGPERNNRLTRYLQAVVRAAGLPDGSLASLMEELWERYLLGSEALLPVSGNRSGWGIPITRLAIAPMPDRVFLCSTCGYLSAETVLAVCVRCQGSCDYVSSEELSERDGNYYRELARFALSEEAYPDPFPLKALEHTAQISPAQAAMRERHFQDKFVPVGPDQEDAKEHRVDVLSVTTTMEMGIDIGDLTTVGLNGTPPTVASYQQRAGRAGRRSDGTAAVVTFTRDRSHDQYYYSRVEDIVTGQVRVPEVHLGNPVIAQRHLNSLVLHRYFSLGPATEEVNLFGAFGTVGSFKKDTRGGLRGLERELEAGRFRDEVEAAGRRALRGWAAEVSGWLDELPVLISERLQGIGSEEDLLATLITKGILPRYAFPVDLVSLWTKEPSRYNRGEEVQRDLQIALSEYAPDAEVVIDGYRHRSVGLYTPYESDPRYEPDTWFYECPDCHHVQVAERRSEKPDWTGCPVCGSPITGEGRRQPVPAIRPQGFRTDWTARATKYRGGARERAGFSTAAQLSAGGTASQGEVRFAGRLWLHCRTGDLYTVNHGSDHAPGFWICPRCGRSLDRPGQEHRRPAHPGGQCGGRPQRRSSLLHRFQSDVAILGVDLPESLGADPTRAGGRAAWLSLGAALQRAAAAYLQIEATELDVGMRPWMHPSGRLMGEVFVYDTLPNGAGYADEVAGNIEAILEEAYKLCAECPGECETACYSCLLDYANQRQHGLLDRGLARDLLAFVQSGVEPELAWSQQLEALERLKNFASAGTMEVDVSVNGVRVPATILLPDGTSYTVWPTHTLGLVARGELERLAARTRTTPLFPAQFDLLRRPFWIWSRLQEGSVREFQNVVAT